MREAARVELVPHLLAGADGNRALHDDDRALLELGQLVEHPPDRGEVCIAGMRRRGRHGDEGDARSVEDVRDVERVANALAVCGQELGEPRLEDRHAPGLELGDPLRHDVANDDLVAEVGEASCGHEADPASADDAEWFFHPQILVPPRGFKPFAIASIVSLDMRFRSVLVT